MGVLDIRLLRRKPFDSNTSSGKFVHGGMWNLLSKVES